MECPHCQAQIAKGGKVRTSIVVLHKAGVEFNCPACRRAVFRRDGADTLTKAERPGPALVVRVDKIPGAGA